MSVQRASQRGGSRAVRILLLLNVVASGLCLAAAASSDASGTGNRWERCFASNAKPPVPRHIDQNDTELTLEVSKRLTHQLMTHIFRIILQEKLGYAKVRITEYDDYNATLITERMICWELGHMNPLEKVPTSMINLAVPVAPDFTTHVTTQCIKEMGTLSWPESFGWFIPVEFIALMREAERAETRRSLNVPWTHFTDAAFARRFSITETGEAAFLDDLAYADKARKAFHCTDARCTSGKYVPPQCRTASSCATIIAGDFGPSRELIEHVNDMQVLASVHWVGDNHLVDVVERLKAIGVRGGVAQKGFIVMSWTPSATVFDLKQFVSVTMKRCDYARGGNQNASGCFYGDRRPVKFAWEKLRKGKNKEDHIFDLLATMNLFEADLYANLMGFYYEHRQQAIARIACDWLRQNDDLVSTEWLTEEQVNTVYIGGIFPISGSTYTGNGIVKGAKMAVKAVNAQKVLPNTHLQLLVADGACRADRVIRSFIDYITNFYYESLIGVLGPACSDTVEPLAMLSKYYRTIAISYSAEGGLFSDRDKYPYFMRTIGENQHYRYVYLEFLKALGWKRVAALTEDGQTYTEYISHMQTLLENQGIKFISNEKFPRSRDKDAITKRLEKLKLEGARIIIADVFDEIARNVMCEAHKLGMTAKHGYVWFLPTWLNYTWYDTTYFNQQFNESVNCTTATMRDAINGYFAMAHAYYGHDDDIMQENITIREWRRLYMNESHGASTSNYAGYAYDAVWAFAYALRKLLTQDPEAIDQLHTSNNTNKLVDILKHLDFNGVSGHIKFRGGPTRFSVINVMQWYNNETRIVAEFFPNISESEGRIVGGELKLRKDQIVWLSHKQPEDGPPPEQCTLHGVATFLNVSCHVALILTNIVFVAVFLLVLGSLIYYVLKKNYDKKMTTTNDYMKSLGLDHLLNSNYNGLDDWEVDKENVVLNRKLGEGAFGTVYGGEALLEDLGWTGVAVKTLKLGSTTEEKLDFLSEAEVMKRFDHKNIVKLLGVCTKMEPVYTIMEFMLYGDLKTYLLARRHLVNGNDEEVSSKKLTSMALDVARGLSYLASISYVHRDIACRNCLVSEQRIVKLCDFGMTRPVATYYRFNRKGMLPVRWMAPESLALGVFTTSSDVWSYGVLLYEIITFGSFPYQAMSNAEVLDFVKSGNSLLIPQGVKGPLEALLKQCWSSDPKARPAATEIVEYLANNSRLISPCLDVPISSVQTEDSGPLDMQLPDTLRKCSSSASFKNLAIGNTQEGLDSGISIPMENCCPKAPLLPSPAHAGNENKYAHMSPQHLPAHDSPPQKSLEDVNKDYIPCAFINGHAISKV